MMTEEERHRKRVIQIRRRKQKRRRTLIMSILAVIILVIVVSVCFCTVKQKKKANEVSTEKSNQQEQTEEKKAETKEEKQPEDDIYTYLQGIKSYEKGKKWTGKWCYEQAGEIQFSSFGCGLCCIANVVSTTTETKIDPGEAYQTAQEVSSYSPDSAGGAIGWSDMMTTLNHYGVQGKLMNKPETYEEFQQDMSSSLTLVALISSDNDNSYWKDVPGHYITLWLYNSDTDQVFLGDSAKPSYNRQWISLRTVYDALKTSSTSQYLEIMQSDSV